MNKILELSKKIHAAGFEPDMWYNTGVISTTSIDFRGLGLSEENDWAYFSADWCWKVLPRVINNEYSWFVIDSDNRILLTARAEGGLVSCIDIKDSLHEALLEMVCWCIDNGFLKGER